MKKILFASDIDNTLLYSQNKMPENLESVCVEYLEDKPQGYFSKKTLKLLAKVNKQTCFIPVTTRSLRQYRRINWPKGTAPVYALVANGAILLKSGDIDEDWRRETEKYTKPYKAEIFRLYDILTKSNVFNLCRIVDEAYLFARAEDKETAAKQAELCRNLTNLEVRSLERKVYFFPPQINKGEAILRLKKLFSPNFTISAGDSLIDLPMLKNADLALAPSENLFKRLCGKNSLLSPQDKLFSEWLLEEILAFKDSRKKKFK